MTTRINAASDVESRCRDAVQILIALVQTHRHLVPVRSASLWRDAHFDIAHAALSSLSGLDRSCCGGMLILTLPVQLRGIEVFHFSRRPLFEDLARVSWSHGALLEVHV